MATSLTFPTDGVALLRMEEPRANALSTATIKALAKKFYEVEQSSARVLVVTGKGRTFCAGLDLIEASAFDRRQLADYVDDFEAFFLQLLAFRLPVVAALNGSALAGGAVVACAADVRVAPRAEGFEIGLNEVDLGIPFPSAALETARFALPRHRWTEALMLARRYSATEAKDAEIVHELADDVVERALARAAEIAQKGALAVQKTKIDLRHEALTRARAKAVESRRHFVEAWFADEGKARIKALVDRLQQKLSAN